MGKSKKEDKYCKYLEMDMSKLSKRQAEILTMRAYGLKSCEIAKKNRYITRLYIYNIKDG